MSSPNARRFKRIACRTGILLECEHEKIEAISVDISENGIRLFLDQMPLTSSRFNLIFKSEMSLRGAEILVSLIWINGPINNGKYLGGFVFSKISDDDRLKIFQFAEELIL